MMARVRRRRSGSSAFRWASSFLGSMLKVRGSMSTNAARAPSRATAPAVAKNVKGTVMTSSPGPTPSVTSDSSSASEPEAHPTA